MKRNSVNKVKISANKNLTDEIAAKIQYGGNAGSAVETCRETAMSDEDYWEEMLFISRGPNGWNIGCGCG